MARPGLEGKPRSADSEGAMLTRARQEDGFGMIELVIAIVLLSVALLALMAGYDSAFMSLKSASHEETASSLANAQLELYSALSYNSIGLDKTTVESAEATDTNY